MLKIPKTICSPLLVFIQSFSLYRKAIKTIVRKKIVYECKMLSNSEVEFLAYTQNKKIGEVSAIEAFANYEGWWIVDLWVDWRYRGLGVGSELVREACEYIFEQGAPAVNVLVFEDNLPAINLYKKKGFQRISIPSVDKDLVQEYSMTKRKRIIFSLAKS